MALQNNFFNFDGKIYTQTDGVAMKILNLYITENM